MKKKFNVCALLALCLTAFFLTAFPLSAIALDDDEMDGYAADTLTIQVGYIGGPYYEKAVFTLDQLWAMDLVRADYTFIDNMPSVVIDHVVGVRLSDIMDAAGIDLNSIQNFHFMTVDKEKTYFTTFPKTSLIDTPRYCYYSLPENFDQEEGMGNEFADADKVRVETVMALADDWNRVIAGATFGSDYQNLNTYTRFRLIYGQTDTYTRTADRSAKWVHTIVVELGGAPTITMDASVLELEVGSVHRATAKISAADSAIAQQGTVTWSSSDESVASVDQEGNITVHGEGEAVITATFEGASTSLVVNGTAPEQTEEVPPQEEETPTPPVQSPDPSPVTSPAQPSESSQGGSADASPNPSTVVSAVTTPTPSSNPVQPTSDPNASNINPQEVPTVNQEGGVQNWRVYEMSETAVELPEIEQDNPLLLPTAIITIGLFAGAILYRILKFLIDTEELHVFHKPI